MSEDKTAPVSDPVEQEVWDQVVSTIYQLAQMAQKLRFNKYKLNYQLETNIGNNHSSTINKLANIIIDLSKEFHRYYKDQLQVINELYKTHANKPRILLMLDATKDNLENILTYNTLKEPTLTELQNRIKTSQLEPTKVETIAEIPPQSNN